MINGGLIRWNDKINKSAGSENQDDAKALKSFYKEFFFAEKEEEKVFYFSFPLNPNCENHPERLLSCERAEQKEHKPLNFNTQM